MEGGEHREGRGVKADLGDPGGLRGAGRAGCCSSSWRKRWTTCWAEHATRGGPAWAPPGYRNGYGKPRRLSAMTGTLTIRRAALAGAVPARAGPGGLRPRAAGPAGRGGPAVGSVDCATEGELAAGMLTGCGRSGATRRLPPDLAFTPLDRTSFCMGGCSQSGEKFSDRLLPDQPRRDGGPPLSTPSESSSVALIDEGDPHPAHSGRPRRERAGRRGEHRLRHAGLSHRRRTSVANGTDFLQRAD